MADRRIFISYRRDDSGWAASNLFQDLSRHFDVFMDVDSIAAGDDFVARLHEQVDRCDAVVVLIGGAWVTPRLYERGDFVRLEIERALDAGKPLLPVLLDGARMPRESEVPYVIDGLLNRQAAPVRRDHYRADLPSLVKVLRDMPLAPRKARGSNWLRELLRPRHRDLAYRVEDAFEGRVHDDVLAEVVREPERVWRAQPDTRALTVMFCNIAGFSARTEAMAGHEATTYLGDLMTPFTDAVGRRRGTVDRIIGDSLVAFWNAPLEDRTPEANACAAALGVRDALERANREFAARDLPPAGQRAGIATGPCTVGPMGSRRRLEYGCVGDTVNLAARLEALAKAYGLWLLMDEATASSVERQFAVLDFDRVHIRGHAEPLRVFTLVGDESVRADETFRKFSAQFAAGRQAYLGRDWAGAVQSFEAAAGLVSSSFDAPALCQAPLARIRALRERPDEAMADRAFGAWGSFDT